MRKEFQALVREIRDLDASRDRVRSFSFVVGGALTVLAALVAWRNGWSATGAVRVLVATGLLLAAAGAVVPGRLRPVYRVWMGMALVLGFVMTRVLLTLVFLLVVVPTGAILRLFGKRLVDRSPDPEAESYWRLREVGEPDPRQLEEQY